MYNTYNMGIGMVLAVSPADADRAVSLIDQSGQKGYIIGEVVSGDKGITLE